MVASKREYKGVRYEYINHTKLFLVTLKGRKLVMKKRN